MEKAKLKNFDTGAEIPVKFNPKEFSIEKQVQWTQKEGAITDEPPEEFTKPTPATLSVTLHFDSYEEREDVTKQTSELEKLALIAGSGGKKRPPLCGFWWKKLVFKGVVESLSQKFTMFLSDGTPVRCECTLKMKKASQAVTGKSGSGG
jgi:hypothetical protein